MCVALFASVAIFSANAQDAKKDKKCTQTEQCCKKADCKNEECKDADCKNCPFDKKASCEKKDKDCSKKKACCKDAKKK